MKLARLLSVLVVAFGCVTSAWGQAYPTAKPVRIVVATQPGTGSDVIARLLSDLLSKSTGQKFVVDNRGGGGGAIGLAVAAKSPPDGYTLVFGNLGGTVLNPYLYSSLDYDAEKDFENIILVAGLPFMICANPSFPANNLQELIAMAKAKPNTINVALDSSSVRVMHALLSQVSGANFYQVSYNGPAAAITDTLSGRVPVIFETLGAMRPLVAAGKLKPLAISTGTSTDLAPGVKAVAEQGLENFGEFLGWVALQGPKGIPPDIVTYLNAETAKALALPQTRKRLAELGFVTKSGSVKDLTDFINSQRARFGPLIKAANITVN